MTPVTAAPRRGPALLPMIKHVIDAGLALKGHLMEAETEWGSHPSPLVIGYIDAARLARPAGQRSPDGADAEQAEAADVEQADEADAADAVSKARAEIAEYAAKHRLGLGNIYVDHPGCGGSQFRALMISIERFHPQFVLVPHLDHVDSPAGPATTETRRAQIEAGTGATVRPTADGPT
ncbi:hypothetical protein GCM10029976_066630 [Kribbella albertanoniae]|uniref:Uncharacterized protein n=1 Tax=Kribbella albertanoniae TaxID=1266829 RepID=A0A4R4QK50_9ACTN|nr:hypothetical protein [Kribbella albertanoniae]TDC35779.1 hypothetical protein E1261_00170 [Kribbella albertanoniae]